MNVDSQYSGPLDKTHLDFLHCVYKAPSELNRTPKNISLRYIANSLLLSRGEILVISKYLSAADFIKKDNPLDEIDCHVWITHKGIAEVEKIASTNKPKNQVDRALNVPLNPPFIDETRLQELKDISSKPSKFDSSKLIKLCEELNSNYSQGNYYATAMLTRAIMDHVPPIFGKDKFTEVVNNCSGSQSFKKSMKNLEDFQRNISDGILHEKIRDSESLPNKTQVNCSQALDHLLGEIVRILKKSES